MQQDSTSLLKRGLLDIIKTQELDNILQGTKKARIYFGVDPTGPKIHLGHMVILRKLAFFQKLGHKVIFLIGDFTAKIGDPTDRKKMRQPLTTEEVLKNTQDYLGQVNKILPIEDKDNPVEVRYNSDWHSTETKADFLNHAYLLTISQLMERDMFQERLEKGEPISLAEFIYPYLQGYDAVILDADIQIGGSDQTFNMLMGRTLRQKMANKTQVVLSTPLILGTDGRKMSKSYGNTINITDTPNDMFGKIMSMDDSQIETYFTLLTDLTEEELGSIHNRLEGDPKQLKIELAKNIIGQIYSNQIAGEAENYFQSTFVKKEVPKDIKEVILSSSDSKNIVDLICQAGLASSNSTAQRLINQGGVTVNDEKITDSKYQIKPNEASVMRVGKRNFVRFVLKEE